MRVPIWDWIKHDRACPYCKMSKYLIRQDFMNYRIAFCLNCKNDFIIVKNGGYPDGEP